MTWHRGVMVQQQGDGSIDGGDSVNWMGHFLGNYFGFGYKGSKFPYALYFEKGWGG